MVSVVLHRRRRRDRQCALRGEHVDGFVLDRAVEGHLVDALPAPEETAQRARVDDGAREKMRAGRLSLLEDRDRDLAEPFADLERAFEQLAETDRARQTGRAAADDQHTHVDSLAFGIRGRRDVVAGAKRRWEAGGSHVPFRCLTSSVSFGTIW